MAVDGVVLEAAEGLVADVEEAAEGQAVDLLVHLQVTS